MGQVPRYLPTYLPTYVLVKVHAITLYSTSIRYIDTPYYSPNPGMMYPAKKGDLNYPSIPSELLYAFSQTRASSAHSAHLTVGAKAPRLLGRTKKAEDGISRDALFLFGTDDSGCGGWGGVILAPLRCISDMERWRIT